VASAGNPDAESDALVTIPSATIADKLQMQQLSFQGDQTILQHLYWSTGGEKDGFSIIGFAGEFKKDDNDCNKNQLIMVLATHCTGAAESSRTEAIYHHGGYCLSWPRANFLFVLDK
jgi:hypothetical protein